MTQDGPGHQPQVGGRTRDGQKSFGLLHTKYKNVGARKEGHHLWRWHHRGIHGLLPFLAKMGTDCSGEVLNCRMCIRKGGRFPCTWMGRPAHPRIPRKRLPITRGTCKDSFVVLLSQITNPSSFLLQDREEEINLPLGGWPHGTGIHDGQGDCPGHPQRANNSSHGQSDQKWGNLCQRKCSRSQHK